MDHCPHRPPCSGCPRFGEVGLAPPVRQALDALAVRHGLPSVPMVAGSPQGFRHRARLAIRGRVDAPRIGLFEAGTHRIVTVPRCSVHHPLINEVAAALRRAIIATRTPCYNEVAHAGLLRYMQVVIERSSQTAQVSLVANTEQPEVLQPLFAALQEELGPSLHSLWFNANTGRGNVITGERWAPVSGPAAVIESFGGACVFYPPGAFGQNNLPLAERLIGQLRDNVPAGARLVEFHAGVGAITLSLLQDLESAVVNELGEASLEGLQQGLAALPEALRERITVVPGSAAAAAHHAANADVVVVDPPRKGLETALATALRDAPPRRLLYVSCGLDALLRDVATLTERGSLRLTGLTAYDLMPYTGHVEVLAVFDRA
jgi:23S rRNA (uracil1939-C5)-methyltransferase